MELLKLFAEFAVLVVVAVYSFDVATWIETGRTSARSGVIGIMSMLFLGALTIFILNISL